MLFEHSFISPAMSQRLLKLGLIRKPSWWWVWHKEKRAWSLQVHMILGQQTMRAYSLADLGDIIPWGFFQAAMIHKMPGGIWQVKLADGTMKSHSLEVEARAEYLINLVKIGAVSIHELNYPELYNQPAKANSPKKDKLASRKIKKATKDVQN